MATEKLSLYPYKFNNVVLDFPLTWQETSNTIEDVQTSAAGTDIVLLTRADKLSVSVTARMSSQKMAQIQAFVSEPTFTLSRYDAVENNYKYHTVRMRDFSKSLLRKSQDLEISTGVWDVSFNLEEI